MGVVIDKISEEYVKWSNDSQYLLSDDQEGWCEQGFNAGYFIAFQGQQAEIARLTAEVERLNRELSVAKTQTIHAELEAETAEAQLAELRARVRPGVEELVKTMCIAMSHATGEGYSDDELTNIELYAQAIHSILPPVPKVLTERCPDCHGSGVKISGPFAFEPCKNCGATGAIHKAIGGEE